MLDAIDDCIAVGVSGEDAFSEQAMSVSKDQETEICKNLCNQWRLNVRVPTFFAMRLAVNTRIQILDDIVFLARHSPDVDLAQIRNSHPFLSLSLLSCVTAFVDIVNHFVQRPDRRWALCIDELEILSPTLQNEILGWLRSTDRRLRYKLSISPFSEEFLPKTESRVAMSGNDYTQIPLYFHLKKDAARFGKAMLESLLRQHGLDISLSKFLGHTPGEHPTPNKEAPYAPGGRRFRELSNLRHLDPSFDQYLRKRDVSLGNLQDVSHVKRAQVRKLLQIALVRLEYRRFERDPDKAPRSRKRVTDLYTGIEALLNIAEANPRWLIGLALPLVEEFKRNGSVSAAFQARNISEAISRHLSLLSIIPLFTHTGRPGVSVVSLIDVIGEAFAAEVMSNPFKPEPALSFTIDNRTPAEIVDAVGSALNQGAFVFIPSQTNETSLGDLNGKRFRLAYLHAVRYHLPLTFGPPKALSTIWRTRARDREVRQLTMRDIVQ